MLTLYYTMTSPFARKVRLLIRERGGGHLVEEIVNAPLDNPADLRAANPLGKIPVLLTGDAGPLFDSPVIVEYLDTALPGEPLLPPSGPERWHMLRRQAVADGVMEAGVALTFERLRTDAAPSPYWCDRWRRAIYAGVQSFAVDIGALSEWPDIGAIAIAAALDYLDFRHADLDWRVAVPGLTDWFADARTQGSMRETSPYPIGESPAARA